MHGFWLSRWGVVTVACCILLAGAVASGLAAQWQSRTNAARIAGRVTTAAQIKREQIEERFRLYQYGLRGVRGAVLAAGTDELDDATFKRYALSRDIDSEFPGARGFGFIRRVGANDIDRFVANTTRAGNAGFELKQLGDHNGDHYIIEFIEPLERNQAAKGLDIGSESRRRAAAERAARNAEVTLTAPITLLQATGAAQQGALILLPVYRSPVAPVATADRLAELSGWSYAPLVLPEVLSDLMRREQIVWQLTDLGSAGDSNEQPSPLFLSDDWETTPATADRQAYEVFTVFGRRWALAARATPAFVDDLALLPPAGHLTFGLALSTLLALLAAALLTLRRRRLQDVAKDLRLVWLARIEEERSRLGMVIDGTAAGTWEWNVQTGETRFNERWAGIIGYTLDELGPVSIDTWMRHAHPDDLAQSGAALEKHFSGAAVHYECEARMRHRDGHWVWVLDRGKVKTWTADGKPEWMFGVHLDISERKQQELALRESEALLEEIGVVAQVGGWSLDLASQHPRWTRQTRRIHGVADDFVPTLDIGVSFYAPEARETISAAVAKALADGTDWDLELPFIRADGSRIWVRATGHPVVEDGKVVKLIGGFQDITDAFLRRGELQEANERLEAATLAAGIGVWDVEPSGERAFLSRQMYALHGHDPSEKAPGFARWAERIHPEDRDHVQTSLVRALRASGPLRIEYRVIWPDGSNRLIEAIGQRVPGPGDAGKRAVGVCRDITEERAAEDAVRAVRDRLALATSVGQIGVWEWDIALGTLEWDPQMFALYGMAPDTDTANYDLWLRHVHPIDAPAAAANLQRAVDDPACRYDIEFRILRDDGSQRIIKAAGTVIRDETGKPRQVIGVNLDVTDQRQAEQALSLANVALEQRVRERTRELEDAKEAAEQANLAKSEFLANMSHELRTPLHGILGFAKLVREDFADDEESGQLNRFCTRIIHNGDQLLELVNGLLDAARIETGSFRVEREHADLAALIRQVLAEFPDAQAGGSVIDYAGPPSLAAHFDPRRLGQVVRNLVSNALKFAPRGSRVEVGLQCDAEAGSVQISVADRGPGIPEAELEAIFDRFTQSSRTKSGAGGSGLGLTIARGIMVQHGGDLTAQNRAGGGACFIATLKAGERPG